MTLLGIQSARRILNSNLFTENVVLKRAPVGAYVKGVWTEGVAPAAVTLRASVAPPNGRMRETLPEGYRLRQAYMVYIATTDYDKIQPMRKGTGASDQDVITVNGVDFSVYNVPDDYANHGFVGVLVVREDG